MSLLTPNRWKFRKQHRWRLDGAVTRWARVEFWDFWIKAISSGYITSRQLEAARKVIVRKTRKIGKIWFRVFPDVPYTKKWLEMPMGKGKWDVDCFRVRVLRWKVLFEISWLSKEVATEVFRQASFKLPIQTTIVARDEIK
jgi:large subunit ribosomal protein L16